jgi:hypothetical protein
VFAVAASGATPTQAQNNIERVTVASEGRDDVTFDVAYSYGGSEGDNVFISAIMANNGKISSYYAHRPGGVQRGRHSTRVNLSVNQSAPNVFSTNQIRVAMYVGGKNPFMERSFFFPKTWSRPGGELQPVLQIVGGVKSPADSRTPITPSGVALGGGAPIRRVLPNGHVELRYPDGTIRERYRGGETVTNPDGSQRRLSYASAQWPTPPSAPPDTTHAKWLDAENTRLLDIMRTMVGNDEPSVQHYLSQESSGISTYQQITSRTDAIGMLVRP